MPLRDHFRPPLDKKRHWSGFHGGWPMQIVAELGRHLPARYFAEPQVHPGGVEVDVATFRDEASTDWAPGPNEGGVATEVWAPARPTMSVETDLPTEADEYAVRVYDSERDCRLVASVEIVSPANKDRPERRRDFVAKCSALLEQLVSVAIIDLVSIRQFNLYAELIEALDRPELKPPTDISSMYAATCRWRREQTRGRFESWATPLAVGQALPQLPLWLSETLAIPLDLEPSYEATCQILRIA